MVLLGHQRLEGRVALRRTGALRELRELEPALVVLVDRLEEGARLAGMDEHRDAELARLAPEREDARVVHRHALAGGVLHLHAEVLEDLEPDGAALLHVALELRRGALAPAGVTDAPEVHVGERHEPAGCDRAVRLDAGGQRVARAPAQVDHPAHVHGVHLADEARDLARRHADVLMAVHVDERELRARHRMRRDAERGARVVLLDRHRLGGVALLGAQREGGEQDRSGGESHEVSVVKREHEG